MTGDARDLDDDPTMIRIDGPTPNGGVASEAHYSDDDGNPAPKSRATHVEIVELDAQGNHIWRTYADLRPPAAEDRG